LLLQPQQRAFLGLLALAQKRLQKRLALLLVQGEAQRLKP